MTVKIKISYNTDEELNKLIRILSPILKECKTSRNKEGKYKKAYMKLSVCS